MTKALPYMPFYVSDWMTATCHWTDAERGAYASLIFFQWANKKLPTDAEQLARIMGTPPEEFDARWAVIGAKFDGDADGLFNHRVEEHREVAVGKYQAKVRAADAANAVRRAKKAQRVRIANADGDASASGLRDAEGTQSKSKPNIQEEESQKEGEHEREPEERTANVVRASRETFKNYFSEEKWILFTVDYPHRAGGNNKQDAKKAWRARLREGHTWDELFAGKDRYKAYCEAAGKIGTEYVMQMKTFCGPSKRFLEDWEIPPEATRGETWSPPTDDPPEAA